MATNCRECGDFSKLFLNHHTGDTVCHNCGMVSEEKMIDFSCSEYNFSSNEIAHHGIPCNIFLPNSTELENPQTLLIHSKISDGGEVFHMNQCKVLLKSVLKTRFQDTFPTTLYETALEIMLISAKTENRSGGKKTPKDIRYNLYTSLLLAILSMDKCSFIGICREKNGTLRFIEELSGVSMKESSLCKRIKFKFHNEDSLRKSLEKKMNVYDAKHKMRNIQTHISLNKHFNLDKAFKNYERRMRNIKSSSNH